MSYTIYRNVHIIEIKNEKVTPMQRISDISGDTYHRDPYYVTKAYFSNYQSGTIHELGEVCKLNQSMSIAINEHHQVIAVVNHITGKHKMIYESTKGNIKDFIIFLLFSTPIIAFGVWLTYRSLPYFKVGDNTGFLPLSFGLAAIAFYIFLLKEYKKAGDEPKQALAELLKK